MIKKSKPPPHYDDETETESPVRLPSILSHPRHVPGPTARVPSRAEQVRRLQQQQQQVFDVLVIGGGVTGCGIALDVVTRGLSVACVERGDFASETSSRSTKLIWAGIKYMATAFAALLQWDLLTKPFDTWDEFWHEMSMVWHCHQERRYMLEKQSHLTYWLPIAVPFDRWIVTPPPLGHPLYALFPFLAPLVFKMYDALSYFSCPPSYIMTKSQAQEAFPQLEDEHLKYVSVFYEGHHNDARTNLAIALSAAAQGATMANYVEMQDLLKDPATRKVVGAAVMDRTTGHHFEVRARTVVLAGGPFTDKMRQKEHTATGSSTAVQAAWGTHIVLPGHFVPKDMGLLDYNTSDGRFLFIAPWQGHTLVGTTDKKGPASSLHLPPEEDVEWLVQESHKYLKIKAQRSDVLSAWRGWRPLANDPHAPAGAVSRDHIISENPETGVLFVAGGKWTTWREMAQDVTDKIVGIHGPKCTTLDLPLYGAEGYSETLVEQLVEKYQWSLDIVEHLVATYGGHAEDVCEIAQARSGREKRLVDGYPYIQAEVVYACQEYACTIEDILSRRTRLAFLNKEKALEALPLVADIMAKELAWSRAVKKNQIELAEIYIESFSGREPYKVKGEMQQKEEKVLS